MVSISFSFRSFITLLLYLTLYCIIKFPAYLRRYSNLQPLTHSSFLPPHFFPPFNVPSFNPRLSSLHLPSIHPYFIHRPREIERFACCGGFHGPPPYRLQDSSSIQLLTAQVVHLKTETQRVCDLLLILEEIKSKSAG